MKLTALFFASLSAISPFLLAVEDRAPQAPDTVVMTVNETPIYESQVIDEVDSRINVNIASDLKKGLVFEESARPQMRNLMRDGVLQSLIERTLIQQQLKADQIEITEAEVDARFQERAALLKQTPEEAMRQIESNGGSLSYTKERIRWQAIGIEKLYAKHSKEQKVLTEAEALKEYSDYPGEYDRPEERCVSHILINTDLEADEASKAAARSRAEALLVRVKAGEDFATLAQNHSEDQLSRAKGGDRGYSTAGVMPDSDPFTKAAFSLKNIGDVSDVVESNLGFHIIKLTGLKPARRLKFEEVKAEMIESFRKHEIGAFWEEFGGRLQAQAKLVKSEHEITREAKASEEQKKLNEKIEADIARQKQADTEKETKQPDSPPAH
jgi:parvulin-like peptidyl-prolyl isomerase